MTFGDKPFDMAEPTFTHGEVVEITGVPSKTLNNWTQREVIDLGTMHRTGRRLYSVFDLIELKVIGELVEMVNMPPAQASTAAKWARSRAFDITARDANGGLLYKGQKQERRHFLEIWFENGAHKIAKLEGMEWFTNHSCSHPFIIVPLDDIVLRVVNKSFEVLEREHSKGGAE